MFIDRINFEISHLNQILSFLSKKRDQRSIKFVSSQGKRKNRRYDRKSTKYDEYDNTINGWTNFSLDYLKKRVSLLMTL